jgi:hypothetical protein
MDTECVEGIIDLDNYKIIYDPDGIAIDIVSL